MAVEPNFQIFLWFLLIMFAINSVLAIIMGAKEVEKSTHFNFVDVIFGIINIIVVFLVLIL